jgi:hypothetical protein
MSYLCKQRTQIKSHLHGKEMHALHLIQLTVEILAFIAEHSKTSNLESKI